MSNAALFSNERSGPPPPNPVEPANYPALLFGRWTLIPEPAQLLVVAAADERRGEKRAEPNALNAERRA